MTAGVAAVGYVLDLLVRVSSRIVIVIRSVAAIEAPGAGSPAAGQLAMVRKADI
ncbi:hypothetical protein VSR68_21685 [Paraburkholderia phymatum]|uniref:hypothetical protein n=1 Tax=Paraburkholderia phymatum TaxID=148447 RepID=UPI0031799BF3